MSLTHVVCVAKVDLAILIDGSGSVDQNGLEIFRRERDFVKKIVRGFQVSRYSVHVGIIIFANAPKVSINRSYNIS